MAAGATCFNSMMTHVAGSTVVLNNMAMCRVRQKFNE